MDGLRWLLLVAGVVVIAIVYFSGRRRANKPDIDDESAGASPASDAAEDGISVVVDDYDDNEPALEPIYVDEPAADDAEEQQPEPQKIVTLRIVARNQGFFKGDDLILSLRGLGMRHGKFGIFHRLDGEDEDATIFSAASLVEPGSFDLANIRDQQIPGISLFLVVPGPIDGADAFDMMIEAARTISQGLNGELLDESGSTLSIQRERYLREEVIQFEHNIRVA